ncbi:MAG: phosphoribosyltransferase [Candidatus Thorarchaeota archaeon]|jgi:hypothetical protein
MDNFKKWLENQEILEEGWSIDFGKIPLEELKKRLHVIVSTENKGSLRKDVMNWLLDLHKTNGIIKFSPTDNPYDFIDVEPLNEPTRKATWSVQGTKGKIGDFNIPHSAQIPGITKPNIYYGVRFKRVSRKPNDSEFKSEFLNLTYDQAEKQADKCVTKKKLSQEIIDDFNSILADLRQTEDIPDDEILNHTVEVDGESKTTVDIIKEKLKKKKHYVPEGGIGVHSTKSFIQKILDASKECVNKFQSPKLKDTPGEEFMTILQQLFSWVIKHPISQHSQKLQDDFIKMTGDHFYNMNPNKFYHYVVYPESSSPFTKKLSEYLGNKFKQTNPKLRVVHGFEKRSKPKIDADRYQKYKMTTDKGLSDFKGSMNYLQSQIDSSERDTPDASGNLAGPKKHQIKGVKGSRQFVRMMQLAPTATRNYQDPETGEYQGVSFRNKNILVIDDNISSGGTAQDITQLIRQQGPRNVDIYVPLYAKFHNVKYKGQPLGVNEVFSPEELKTKDREDVRWYTDYLPSYHPSDGESGFSSDDTELPDFKQIDGPTGVSDYDFVQARFHLNGTEYYVTFNRMDDMADSYLSMDLEVYEISWDMLDQKDFARTNKNTPFQVMSKVLSIITDFNSKVKPEAIYYEPGDDMLGSFYNRIFPKMFYNYEREEVGSKNVFYIRKDVYIREQEPMQEPMQEPEQGLEQGLESEPQGQGQWWNKPSPGDSDEEV